MQARDKLSKARAGLILDHPFFGALALRMPLTEDRSCETLATDGTAIYYSPSFVDSLTLAQAKGVIAHEVMHPAMAHHTRRGSRDPRRWNIAADYAINPLLTAAGLELPPGALNDPAYRDQEAERIYAHLPQQSDDGGASNTSAKPGQGAQSSTPQSTTADPGRCGEIRDLPAGADPRQSAQDWKIAVTQAATMARAMGRLPGAIDRLVRDLLNPVVPWQDILREFVERSARNDYTWTAPSRRYMHTGLYLPSLISEELPEIVIAVDTSGSISPRELHRFGCEISDILYQYDTTIRVLYADAGIAHTETYDRADLPLVLRARGGGGTDFRPAFAWVERAGITPACLIYLTDLYGTWPDAPPDYPVLWTVTQNHGTPCPWGELIEIQE